MPDDYYVSQYSGEEIDALLGGAGAGTVRYDAAQSLTDEQKARARSNIGSAPDGYGLGGYATQLPGMSCNEAVYNGWYINQGNDSENCPKNGDVALSYGTLLVSAKSYTNVMQFYFPAISNFTGYCIRTFDGTTWTPWEWPNPPLALGVEYRTTERYNGQPVYVKMVNCGVMANNKNVSIVTESYRAIDVILKGSPMLFPMVPYGSILNGWQGGFYCDGVSITLYAGQDLAGANQNAIAIVKFVSA